MKLRNRKTGEIISEIDVSQDHESIWVLENKPRVYHSLAELNAEWEDYKPKEPLIGDETTAKFVRDWAKHWGIDALVAHIYEGSLCLVGWTEPSSRGRAIDILSAFVSGEVEEGGHYTIAELCGEEE